MDNGSFFSQKRYAKDKNGDSDEAKRHDYDVDADINGTHDEKKKIIFPTSLNKVFPK
jgi:hypothetical protein